MVAGSGVQAVLGVSSCHTIVQARVGASAGKVRRVLPNVAATTKTDNGQPALKSRKYAGGFTQAGRLTRLVTLLQLTPRTPGNPSLIASAAFAVFW